MQVLMVAFSFVLLCGSGFALPDVGRCSFMEYFCNARRCTTVFYKDLQKDPLAQCSVKFSTMVNCVKKVANDCVSGRLSKSQVDAIVDQHFEKSTYCLEGSFEPPKPAPGVTLPCTNTYLRKAPLCGKTFHEKFVANWSDPTLCSEETKAKKCVKDLLASECTFDSQSQELLDLAFSDHNPFCADNRDPGATGKDQCYLYNKSDVISVKQMALLFSLGFYFVLV